MVYVWLEQTPWHMSGFSIRTLCIMYNVCMSQKPDMYHYSTSAQTDTGSVFMPVFHIIFSTLGGGGGYSNQIFILKLRKFNILSVFVNKKNNEFLL